MSHLWAFVHTPELLAPPTCPRGSQSVPTSRPSVRWTGGNQALAFSWDQPGLAFFPHRVSSPSGPCVSSSPSPVCHKYLSSCHCAEMRVHPGATYFLL